MATLDDEAAVERLMKESAAILFPRFYDELRAASAVRYVAQADPMLLRDGTYFVLESGDEMVACGGWSRRDSMYTGSGDGADDARALDPATEPARVRAMFVRADWTRRGLGRRILEACEAAAREEGFGELDARGHAARCAAVPRVRVRAARGGRGRDAGRRQDRLRLDGEADRGALTAVRQQVSDPVERVTIPA